MNQKIQELLKEYKAKEVEIDGVNTTFYLKQIKVGVQIEDENEYQFWIEEVTGVDLPEEYYNNIFEFGDIEDLDGFMLSIINGEYNYIKSIYNSLTKLSEKYEDDLETMLKYFT